MTSNVAKSKTPTETDPGKRRRRSLFRDSRNGCGTSLKGGFLDESDSESSSDDDLNPSQPEVSYTKKGKTNELSSSTKENMPPTAREQRSE